MEATMVVGAVIVAGGVLVGLLIRGRRRAPGGRHGTQTRTGTARPPLPRFNIVAVGLPGAGKTVLLASIYHRFQTPSGGRSYCLEAPDAQARDLNASFLRISDTSAPWPAGTSKGEFNQFHFTASAPVRGGGFHDAFTIRYTEYAGELLVANSQDGSQNQQLLRNALSEAHAVMALLDGYDVLRVIDGDSTADGRLQYAVSTFVNALRHVDSSVSFVITKWDLLQQTGRTDAELLDRVRSLLWSNDAFRWLVERQDVSFTVRLFPVSAVGPGFARIDDDGLVIKTTAATTHPTGVTLPFVSVLPDLFDRTEAAARHRARLHRQAAQQTRTRQQQAELRFNVLTSALDQLSGVVPGGGLSAHVVRWIVGVDPRIAQEAGLPPELAWLDTHDAQDGAGLEAARAIVKEMRREMDAMEGALPQSVLRRVG